MANGVHEFDFDYGDHSTVEKTDMHTTLGQSEATIQDLAAEAMRRMAATQGQAADAYPTDAQIDLLCDALLSPNQEKSTLVIADMLAHGVSLETLYLECLAEAARRMGEWWLQDQVTFVDVTIATGRMMSMVHGLARTNRRAAPDPSKAAIFAAVPGETHTFGVNLAADLFRQDGWDITLLAGLSHQELVKRIAASDIQIVGLSVGGEHSTDAFTRLIKAVRKVKPFGRIIVSGPLTVLRPDQARDSAPDGIASDIAEARKLLNRFRAETPMTV